MTVTELLKPLIGRRVSIRSDGHEYRGKVTEANHSDEEGIWLRIDNAWFVNVRQASAILWENENA